MSQDVFTLEETICEKRHPALLRPMLSCFCVLLFGLGPLQAFIRIDKQSACDMNGTVTLYSPNQRRNVSSCTQRRNLSLSLSFYTLYSLRRWNHMSCSLSAWAMWWMLWNPGRFAQSSLDGHGVRPSLISLFGWSPTVAKLGPPKGYFCKIMFISNESYDKLPSSTDEPDFGYQQEALFLNGCRSSKIVYLGCAVILLQVRWSPVSAVLQRHGAATRRIHSSDTTAAANDAEVLSAFAHRSSRGWWSIGLLAAYKTFSRSLMIWSVTGLQASKGTRISNSQGSCVQHCRGTHHSLGIQDPRLPDSRRLRIFRKMQFQMITTNQNQQNL